MANQRVSDLSAGGAITATDLFYAVQMVGAGGVKVTAAQLQEFVEDELNGAFVSGSNITVTYDDTAGTFTFDFTGTVPADTDDLPEGSTNLYFTNERVDDRVAALIQNGTGLTWTYDDTANTLTGNVSLAAFSTTNLAEGTNLYFTDERAQDAVGGILTDSSEIDFTYNDGANTISATLINNSVVAGRIAFSATTRLLGRSSGGAGAGEEITVGTGLGLSGGSLTSTITQYTDELAQDAVGGALTDSSTIDFTYNDGANTITAIVIDNSITDAKLRTSGALSVIGRSANSTGNVADISASNDGEVLRRSGTTLGFGTVATAGIADDAVTNAKLANMAEATIKGRAAAAGTGDPTDLTAAQVLTILGLTGLEVLTANRDYYVRTDGSNSNTGLADSSGGAFLTIAKAVSTVYGIVIPAGVTVTINIGGTQSGARTFQEDVSLIGPILGGGVLRIIGDTTTPANRIIEAQTTGCIVARSGARVVIGGLRFTQSGTGKTAVVAFTNSFIDCGNLTGTGGPLEFGSFASGRHMWAADGGLIDVRNNYTVNGNAVFHLDADNGKINVLNATATYSGTPAFTTTANATNGGIIQATMTQSGSATGTRYSAAKNGIINTFGGGANYFPGNVAGATATQGQYF